MGLMGLMNLPLIVEIAFKKNRLRGGLSLFLAL